MLEKRTNFQFVSSVDLFENWPNQSMFGLLTHVKIKNCSLGDYVYKKGDKDSNIYMVYKGEVQIMTDRFKDTTISDQDDPMSLKKQNFVGELDAKEVES